MQIKHVNKEEGELYLIKDLVIQRDLVLRRIVVVSKSVSTELRNLQSRTKVKLKDTNLLILIKKL